MKIQEKKELLQLIETVRNLQEKIKNNISSEDEKNVLINCQEAAIAIGTEIEKKYSDNIQIVHELEQYCELIYEISQIKEKYSLYKTGRKIKTYITDGRKNKNKI